MTDCIFIPKCCMEDKITNLTTDCSDNNVGAIFLLCLSFFFTKPENHDTAVSYDTYVSQLIDEEHTFYAKEFTTWSYHGHDDGYDDDDYSADEIF